jgi:hypothetical protein
LSRIRARDRSTAAVEQPRRIARWPRADLAARSQLSGDAQAVEKGELLQVLGHCKVAPEREGLRDPEALARLPEP